MGACGSCQIDTTATDGLPALGRLYVGIRPVGAEDGRETLCFAGDQRPSRGTRIVAESDRGLEFAEVINERPLVIKSCQTKGARRMVRVATDDDVNHLEQKRRRERRAFLLCHEKAGERQLELKIVRSELDWDQRRLQILYTAENRVDFRELVRDIAKDVNCRVEMRQIGVRDGTRVTGGLGPCGLTLCCSTFLHEFHPVTIRMAKNQNLSLNPSKISGQCGRLMCCLAYENDNYADAGKGRGRRGGKRSGSEPPAAPPRN